MKTFIVFLSFAVYIGVVLTPVHQQSRRKEVPMNLQLSSSAFTHGGPIPKKYTCDGENISSPLSWKNAPSETKSFVLIIDDPDAPDPASPRMVWVHWILYNIPPSVSSLPEGVPSQKLPQGTLEGINDFKKKTYGGPCPPIGRHRYFHKLYALDIVLPDMHAPSKQALEKSMDGHILAKAELVGTYQR